MVETKSVDPWAVKDSKDLQNLDAVVRLYPQFKWKTHPGKGGAGRTAYAVLSRNEENGDVWVFAVIENTAAPRHTHVGGAIYGEMILTIAGVLHDLSDDGSPVDIHHGESILHAGDTTHEPAAQFWFGLYHQPRGSYLADQPGAA